MAFFEYNFVNVRYYATKTRVDFGRQEDYVSRYFEWFLSDSLDLAKSTWRSSKLRINKVSFEDSIIDPFEQETDEISYLQAVDVEVRLD